MDEQKKILIFYGVFFSSFFIAMIPVTVAAVFGIMVCACTLAAIYMERTKATDAPLLHNHMTFLIRSFWRANLYLLGTFILGLIYLLLMANYETFTACINVMSNAINHGDIDRVMTLAKACEQKFLEENATHLIITAIIAFAPIVLYLLYRFALGWTHGVKNALVADDKL